ncbi:MAG: hypothetical protein EU542_03570 [Promethearchaeota archaeon]|nr:MAG: hypothetical protein EU542_03570 [Candidatus Lokiarchaeota archaeon]
MNESLTPEAILTDVSRGKINQNLAVDLLLSLIEKSNNLKLREDCIRALHKLSIPKEMLEDVYKTIESCLLSDESQFVRNSAAILISEQLLKYGEDALTWTIQHDSSPLIINTLIKIFLEKSKNVSIELTEALQNWLLNYSDKIGIVMEESLFFLEVECLFAQYIQNYEISIDSITYFQHISNVKNPNPFIFIKNRHVESLNFKFYNWLYLKRNQDIINSFIKIKDLDSFLSLYKQYDLVFKNPNTVPSSIGHLTCLKVLNLSGNEIRTIPNFIFSLSNLQELDLSNNRIETIPTLISKLKQLKLFNLKNNNLHNIPSKLEEYLNSLNTFQY